MRRNNIGARRRRLAFSLMEVLLLVAVMGVVGPAAGLALQSMAKVPAQSETSYQIETDMISKMEQIRALGFSSIAVGSPNNTLTDTVTISGATYTRTVNVVLADANGDGVTDATFKQVTVTCGGQTVTTLISQ